MVSGPAAGRSTRRTGPSRPARSRRTSRAASGCRARRTSCRWSGEGEGVRDPLSDRSLGKLPPAAYPALPRTGTPRRRRPSRSCAGRRHRPHPADRRTLRRARVATTTRRRGCRRTGRTLVLAASSTASRYAAPASSSSTRGGCASSGGSRCPGGTPSTRSRPTGARCTSSTTCARTRRATQVARLLPRRRPPGPGARRRSARARRQMQGLPMTRATSADGRFAYTLYVRPQARRSSRRARHCAGRPRASTCVSRARSVGARLRPRRPAARCSCAAPGSRRWRWTSPRAGRGWRGSAPRRGRCGPARVQPGAHRDPAADSRGARRHRGAAVFAAPWRRCFPGGTTAAAAPGRARRAAPGADRRRERAPYAAHRRAHVRGHGRVAGGVRLGRGPGGRQERPPELRHRRGDDLLRRDRLTAGCAVAPRREG